MFKKLFLLLLTAALAISACGTLEVSLDRTPTPAVDAVATIVEATLLAVPSNMPSSTSTSIPAIASTPEPGSDISWVSYHDPKFGFTLEYPANWTIKPRHDKPETSGETLNFAYISDTGKSYSIDISQHTKPISTTDSLSEWTDTQRAESSMYSPDQIQTVIRQNTLVDGLEAFFIRGASPQTEYQFTNIRRGETVWFIWANFGETADEIYLEIYEHMLNSIHFSQSQ